MIHSLLLLFFLLFNLLIRFFFHLVEYYNIQMQQWKCILGATVYQTFPRDSLHSILRRWSALASAFCPFSFTVINARISGREGFVSMGGHPARGVWFRGGMIAENGYGYTFILSLGESFFCNEFE